MIRLFLLSLVLVWSCLGLHATHYTIRNARGMEAVIAAEDARILSLKVPDDKGQLIEVMASPANATTYQKKKHASLNRFSGIDQTVEWQLITHTSDALTLRSRQEDVHFPYDITIEIRLSSLNELWLSYQAYGASRICPDLHFWLSGPATDVFSQRLWVNTTPESRFLALSALSKKPQFVSVVTRPDPQFVKAATLWGQSLLMEVWTQGPAIKMEIQAVDKKPALSLNPYYERDNPHDSLQAQFVYRFLPATPPRLPEPEPGFVSLLSPELQGWDSWLRGPGRNHDPRKVFQMQDGQLHISGEQFGYLSTQKSYTDFHFLVEFRWGDKRWEPRQDRPRDSGICYYFAEGETDKIWPRSLECQIQENDCGDYWLIDSTQISVLGERNQARSFSRFFRWEDHERPHGEWNRVEVRCEDGHCQHFVNGVLVNEGFEPSVRRGRILLQSEGAEIIFRKVMVKDLNPYPFRLNDIHVRDPFILPDTAKQLYYLYAQTGNRRISASGQGVEVYTSKDLEHWSEPQPVLRSDSNFWGRRAVWAPEVHLYQGRYYLFVTFTAHDTLGPRPDSFQSPPQFRRGTQILVADSPLGPFVPFTNRSHTPPAWMALDGTFWVEAGQPWMIFCHEWAQIQDGTIELLPLQPDLSGPAGTPQTLFRASEAPWVKSMKELGMRYDGLVTDGCFLYRTRSGKLLMMWSSFGNERYAMGLAQSVSGKLQGPWKQLPDLLLTANGGHGMLFRTFEGQLKLIYHQPNRHPDERAVIQNVQEAGDTLILEP